MKKYTHSIAVAFFVVILTFSLAVNHGNAQNMSFGPKAGLNLSKMYGDINRSAFIMGVNAGGFFTYQLDSHYAFTAELLFSMKGSKHFINTESMRKRLNYVELPILCQYYFPLQKWPGFYPKVFIGPSFGYMVYAGDYSTATSINTDIKKDCNKLEVGLLAGVGFHKSFIKNTTLIFDVRYQYGLLGVFTDMDVLSDDNLNANMGMLSYNIGLSFPIVKKEKEEKK